MRVDLTIYGGDVKFETICSESGEMTITGGTIETSELSTGEKDINISGTNADSVYVEDIIQAHKGNISITGEITCIADNITAAKNINVDGGTIAIAEDISADEDITISAGEVYVGEKFDVVKNIIITGGRVDSIDEISAGENISISGGTVVASDDIESGGTFSISGGNVNVEGDITSASGDLTILGGNVVVGGTYGLTARNGDIILSWTNADDSIFAYGYDVNTDDGFSVKLLKPFILEDGTIVDENNIDIIEGEKIIPYSHKVTFMYVGTECAVKGVPAKTGKCCEPEDPFATGWVFDGWYSDEAFTTPFDFDTVITGNTTVYGKACKAKGKIGENDSITWKISADGKTLSFSGTGAIPGYNGDKAPWKSVSGYSDVENIVIGDGITAIGKNAFSVKKGASSKITTVTIAGSVKEIGSSAFKYCSKLSTLNLNEGLEIIENNAFSKTAIVSLNLPSTIKKLGEASFSYTGIESVILPEKLEEIDLPFYQCDQLKEISLDSKNKNFKMTDGVLFTSDGKKLVLYPHYLDEKTYIVPEGTEVIGKSAFCLALLDSIVLPESLTTIEDYAFEQSDILELNIPDSVKSIGLGITDNNCLVQKVIIPAGIEKIGLFLVSNDKICFIGSNEEWNALLDKLDVDKMSEQEAGAYVAEYLKNYYGYSDEDIENTLTDIDEYNWAKDELRQQLVNYKKSLEEDMEVIYNYREELTGYSIADIASSDYTGKAIEPKIVVTDGTNTLVEGKHYSVVYKDNVNAGTAKVIVAGTGRYSIELEKEFVINKIDNAPNMPVASMNVSHDIDKVSGVELTGYEGWIWAEEDAVKELIVNESVIATAVYQGVDKDNYKNVSVNISIYRSECKHANTELINVHAATCTENGNNGDVYCNDCKKVIKEGTPVIAEGHKYGQVSYSWSDDYSTCTATTVCTAIGCGATHEETVTSTSTVKENATTEKNGTTVYTAVFADSEVFGTKTIEVDNIPMLKDEGSGNGSGSDSDTESENTGGGTSETTTGGTGSGSYSENGGGSSYTGESGSNGGNVSGGTTGGNGAGNKNDSGNESKTNSGSGEKTGTENGSGESTVAPDTTVKENKDGTRTETTKTENENGSTIETVKTTDKDGKVLETTTTTVETTNDGATVTTISTESADGTKTNNTETKNADGSVETTEKTETIDGTVTEKESKTEVSGKVTTTTSSETTKDAKGNVIGTTESTLKQNKNGSSTLTETITTSDNTVINREVKTDKKGNAKLNETVEEANGNVTTTEQTINKDGTGSSTSKTVDAEGAEVSNTVTETTVNKKNTVTITSATTYTTGEKVENTITITKKGNVTSEIIETAADGSSVTTTDSLKKEKDGTTTLTSVVVEKDKEGNVLSESSFSANVVIGEDGNVEINEFETDDKNVVIPDSVVTNGETIPVTEIGENALKDNKKVKEVTINSNITTIREGAFSGDSKLKTVNITDSVQTIEPGAFEGIKKKAVFLIEASSKKEYKRMVKLIKESGVGKKVKFKRVKK